MGMIQEPVRCTDEGFFGPDSISWRVSGPTIIPGLVYTGVMFFLHPWNAVIGMQNTTGVTNPWDRAVQTAEYLYAVVYGDRATARHAAAVVNAIHDHVKGTWAPTGDRVHTASEPHNLMWLLIPYGQGMLDAYDAYGPKRLTPEERDRFWRDEITVVGELNRIPLELMPKSQAEVDEYFEQQRPYLALTEAGQGVLDNIYPSLISGGTLLPAPAALPVRLAVSSGLALVPDYAMHLMGQRPFPRPVKLAVRAANRPLYASMALTPVARDVVPMMMGDACRTVVRRAREAARTGCYDEPASTIPLMPLQRTPKVASVSS